MVCAQTSLFAQVVVGLLTGDLGPWRPSACLPAVVLLFHKKQRHELVLPFGLFLDAFSSLLLLPIFLLQNDLASPPVDATTLQSYILGLRELGSWEHVQTLLLKHHILVN